MKRRQFLGAAALGAGTLATGFPLRAQGLDCVDVMIVGFDEIWHIEEFVRNAV